MREQTTVPKKKIFFTVTYYGHETGIVASQMKKVCQKMFPHIGRRVSLEKQHTLKQTLLPIQKGLDESKKTNKSSIKC